MRNRELTAAAVILIALAAGLSILLLKSRQSYPPMGVNPSVPRRSRQSPTPIEAEHVSPAAPPSPAPTPLIRSATYEFGLPTPVLIEAPTAKATPLSVVGDVRAPVLIHRVEPEYPVWARKGRVEGMVMIEAVITERGDVVDAHVVQSANPVLNDSALAAIRQWRYQPATLDGRPVRVYLTVTMTFNLH
jgi:TonB family protein